MSKLTVGISISDARFDRIYSSRFSSDKGRFAFLENNASKTSAGLKFM